LFTAKLAATPLVEQQIQRPAPPAALDAATCEADRVLHVGSFFFLKLLTAASPPGAKTGTHMNFD
jgi:hypothetical protein